MKRYTAIAVISAAALMCVPFTVNGAEKAAPESAVEERADNERTADKEGAESQAAEVIGEVQNGGFGTQVVSSASEALSKSDTGTAVEQIRYAAEHSIRLREKPGKPGAFHFSGAGRTSKEIKTSVRRLCAFLTENGERMTEEGKGETFLLTGTEENGAIWMIEYYPEDAEIHFVFQANGNNGSALALMIYDTELLEAAEVSMAAWGAVDETERYAAVWRAPFHRILSTQTDDLTFEPVYTNLAEGYEEELRLILDTLSGSAFNTWQLALTKQQEVGLGELGFGAFDTYGWIRTADKKWMYLYADGTYASAEWKKIGPDFYHFDRNGYMETGWIEERGKKYYCDENGKMVTGKYTIGNETFTFDKDGVLQE